MYSNKIILFSFDSLYNQRPYDGRKRGKKHRLKQKYDGTNNGAMEGCPVLMTCKDSALSCPSPNGSKGSGLILIDKLSKEKFSAVWSNVHQCAVL